MTVMEQVRFHPRLVEGIKSHAVREYDKGGYEAVGFLAAVGTRPGVVVAHVPLANHSSDPERGFFVEPWEQWRAESFLSERGYAIVGVYHSHPSGEAQPSRADVAMARPSELMVIYSVAYGDLRAWREDGGSLEPVEIVND